MLWDFMNQNIAVSQYLDFFLRIVVASACGAVIGMERSHRLKEAGVRTHLLVCCTAALIIIVSKYGFSDLASSPESGALGVRGADPARIAAQVVSGISFLCAGVIYKQGSVVKGLTTAAGLWGTAGIGLAIGAGMYPLGFFATILVFVFQVFMHKLPIHNDLFHNNHIELTVTNDKEFRSILAEKVQEWQAQVIESKITHNQDGTTSYSLDVKMSSNVNPDDIITFLQQNSRVSVFRQTTNS